MKFHTFHIRWRSSLWKLLWRELLVYTASFLIISCIYRTCLYPEQQIIVEKLIRCLDGGSVKEGGGNNCLFARWCRNQSTGVPITFLLGFYVSLVVKRWWEQYCKLPWPGGQLIVFTNLP